MIDTQQDISDTAYMPPSDPPLSQSGLRWMLLLSVSLGAFGLTRALLNVLSYFWHPLLSAYSLVWAASDWAVTAAVIMSAHTLSPKHRAAATLLSSLALTVWHASLLLSPQNLAQPSLSIEAVITSGMVGIFITAALTYAHLGVLDSLRTSSTAHPAGDAAARVTSGAEADKRFGPGDLVLLERELRKNRLVPGEYFSAIQFAFAVERDCDFVNCDAERLKFNQIVLDSAMRLYLANKKESMWLPMANAFRQYDELSSQQRKQLVDRALASLPLSCLAAG
jgi:hypothetical protein